MLINILKYEYKITNFICRTGGWYKVSALRELGLDTLKTKLINANDEEFIYEYYS